MGMAARAQADALVEAQKAALAQAETEARAQAEMAAARAEAERAARVELERAALAQAETAARVEDEVKKRGTKKATVERKRITAPRIKLRRELIQKVCAEWGVSPATRGIAEPLADEIGVSVGTIRSDLRSFRQ
jgi:hypothetical protein